MTDNWTLRKRNNQNGATKTISAPIGMLVPSPTNIIKTQIGDQDADEISDLSEAESDHEYEDECDITHSSIDLPNVLVESKTKIGGKNELSIFNHELLEKDSLVSETSLRSQSPVVSEAKNELLLLKANTDNVNQLNEWNNIDIYKNEKSDEYATIKNENDKIFEPIPAPR